MSETLTRTEAPQVSAWASMRRDRTRTTSLISDCWIETPELIERPDGDDMMRLPVIIFFNATQTVPHWEPTNDDPGSDAEYEFEIVGFAFDLSPGEREPAPLTEREIAGMRAWFDGHCPEVSVAADEYWENR